MFYKIIIAFWCLLSTSSFAMNVIEGETILEPLIGNTLATMAGGANVLIQLVVLWVIVFHTTIRER